MKIILPIKSILEFFTKKKRDDDSNLLSSYLIENDYKLINSNGSYSMWPDTHVDKAKIFHSKIELMDFVKDGKKL